MNNIIDDYDITAWLPTSVKEMKKHGWDSVDVVLFSGDAYVDHPSFGAAVIGRILQSMGLKVAIVPQPNWRDDLRDFKKFGRPNLFFAVSAGAMDSMVNHYTANRRQRHNDAYTPDGKYGMRPDYPTIIYSQILKQLYPDVPIICGGIEASMRRLSHYDYWQDCLRPSIICDAPIDMIIYGMGEKPIKDIVLNLQNGKHISELTDIKQTVVLCNSDMLPNEDENNIILNSYDDCKKSKRCQAQNFKHIEQQSNRYFGANIWQRHGSKVVKVNPMYQPMTTDEIDETFDLPYTRLPHPRYKGKTIPAYEMIKFSINLHRGCYGGCAFCTISAHQGKFIASRSKQSILSEIDKVRKLPDFKGYLSDLGGPSANMYFTSGKDVSICKKCQKPSCLYPIPCQNLNTDHSALLDIYRSVDALPYIKKSFVGSGVRYDLSMYITGNDKIDKINKEYNIELIRKHVSGRLKVAPEHTKENVLKIMRKPPFFLFYDFKKIFDNTNEKFGLKQQLIPYFISSHPGCTECDMAELAIETRDLNMHLEQIQDFTPTPMTLATEIYYTGIHPYSGEIIYTATSQKEKLAQRKYFFWYDYSYRDDIIKSLYRMKRADLIHKLYPKYKNGKK